MINTCIIKERLPFPPKLLSQVKILGGVSESIGLLRERNFEIVVVSNQPDVARGTSTEREVQRINDYLSHQLGLKFFYTCFHDDADFCECRKPKSGLLRMAARDLDIDLGISFMVGDRWRDIAAGQTAGCTCYFIDYSYSEKLPEKPYFKVDSLHQAVRHMIEGHFETI